MPVAADTGPNLGPCPICGRPMIAGPSVDRHHFMPKSEGGRETHHVHRICHRKVHSLFTEGELARGYGTPEAVRAHPEMQAFLRWIACKDPEFYSRTATARRKAGRRR
jgi:hypothetical protein